MREGAQLPIAQVRGGEQHAAAALAGLFEMLEAFVADPIADVAAMDARKAREGHQQARDGAEHTVGDALMGAAVKFGQGHRQIGEGHPPQARQGQIQQRSVSTGQPVGYRQRRPRQRSDHRQRHPVFESVA